MVCLPPLPTSAQAARRVATDALLEWGRPELVDDVVVVVSELVGNAVIHARTDFEFTVRPAGAGVRVEVCDGSLIVPRWTPAAMSATTGRGLILVQRLASEWGVEPHPGGKTVWALVEEPADVVQESSFEELLELWAADEDPLPVPPAAPAAVRVELTVAVAEMLDSRAHTEDLVRELQILALGDGTDAAPVLLVQLARRLAAATEAFHEGRRQMLNQTLSAAQRGQTSVQLSLLLPRDAARAARLWLEALDEADALTRQGVLLLPPFPPEMVEFRRRYVTTVISSLQAP